jgi:hypothetical protein
MTGNLLLLLEAAASLEEAALSATYGSIKSFVLKNIPAEVVNFRTGKPDFEVAGKVVVCIGVLTAQGMSHIVAAVPGCLVTQASYCAIRIRRKRSVERSFKRLEFVAAV